MHLADTDWRTLFMKKRSLEYYNSFMSQAGMSSNTHNLREKRKTKTQRHNKKITTSQPPPLLLRRRPSLLRLSLRLLPLVRHLQQLGHLGRRLVVGREDVVHVLLEAVLAVEPPALLDPARHLAVNLFDVPGGAVGAFEGSPGGEEGDALWDF